MKKFWKIVLVLFGIGLVAALITYLYVFRKPDNVEKLKPDFVIPATELYAQFEANEDSSTLKYKDKVVEVSGTVAEVIFDNNRYTIILRGDMDVAGVQCGIDSLQGETASTIKTGDLVTIKGICTGMLMDVVLNRSVIVTEKK